MFMSGSENASLSATIIYRESTCRVSWAISELCSVLAGHNFSLEKGMRYVRSQKIWIVRAERERERERSVLYIYIYT